MANITVRSEPGRPIIGSPSGFEPNRWLRSMLRWDPFQEMAPIFGAEEVEFSPSFDVKETKSAFVVTADVPGVKASDLDVSVSESRMNISGKRESEREEKSDTYYACERSYGTFARTFTLPEGVNPNAVSADLKDGVLTVSIAKKPEVQAKKIEIKTSAAAKPH